MPNVKSPDSLIAPNSNIRGQGGKESKAAGITVNNKSSAESGLKRTKPAPGWGSNANGQYDPVPPGVPGY